MLKAHDKTHKFLIFLSELLLDFYVYLILNLFRKNIHFETKKEKMWTYFNFLPNLNLSLSSDSYVLSWIGLIFASHYMLSLVCLFLPF